MPRAKKKYPEIEDIKEDVHSLKENTIELTKHVKKDGEAKVGELKDVVADNIDTIAGKGQKQLRNVENQVKAKPLQSIAVAFATGLAISAILKRR